MSELFCVYFEKNTGLIKKISGKKEKIDNLLSITVPYTQVADIYEGKKSFNNYTVEYDINQRQYKLQLANDLTFHSFKFFEISDTVDKPEITVIQHVKKRYWEIKIDKKLAKTMLKDNFYSRSYLSFSITKKGNPHQLYRCFKIDVYSLVQNLVEVVPFIFDTETKDTSVYTLRQFESYSHKVKK